LIVPFCFIVVIEAEGVEAFDRHRRVALRDKEHVLVFDDDRFVYVE